MIQEQSVLKVADNSGAKKVRCFRVLGGTKRRYARIGDIIVASVRSADPGKNIRKKDIIRAVIVRQRQPFRRPDGSYVRFDDNAVVIIEGGEPIGTRVFGPIPREIKEKGYATITSLAKDVV